MKNPLKQNIPETGIQIKNINDINPNDYEYNCF